MDKLTRYYEILLWFFLLLGLLGYIFNIEEDTQQNTNRNTPNNTQQVKKEKLSPGQQKNLNERLIAACKNGKLSAMDIFELQYADVNYCDAEGKTPLMYAASNCYPSSLKLLLSKGADINAKDPDGYDALIYASHRGHVDNTETLIATKQLQHDEDYIKGCLEYSKLMVSSYRNSRGYLEQLEQNRSDLDKVSIYDLTALMTAAYWGQSKSIEILINKGVSLHTVNSKGENALFWAIAGKNSVTVELLLELGADVNLETYAGYTPLYYAVSHKNTEVIALLLKFNANVDDKALTYAKNTKNKQIIRMLQNANK